MPGWWGSPLCGVRSVRQLVGTVSAAGELPHHLLSSRSEEPEAVAVLPRPRYPWKGAGAGAEEAVEAMESAAEAAEVVGLQCLEVHLGQWRVVQLSRVPPGAHVGASPAGTRQVGIRSSQEVDSRA